MKIGRRGFVHSTLSTLAIRVMGNGEEPEDSGDHILMPAIRKMVKTKDDDDTLCQDSCNVKAVSTSLAVMEI